MRGGGGGVQARSPGAGHPVSEGAHQLSPSSCTLREYRIWSQTFCVFLSGGFNCPSLSLLISKTGSPGRDDFMNSGLITGLATLDHTTS